MTAENFCYFLQGYLETSNPEFISAAQTQIIKDHLAIVFNKVTPDRKDATVPFDINKHKSLATVFNDLNQKSGFSLYNSGSPTFTIDPNATFITC